MSDDDDILEVFCVCYRLHDLPEPAPGSWIEKCTECGAEVWRTEGTPREARTVCWPCAQKHETVEMRVMVSDEQRRLFHEMGMTDADIEHLRVLAELHLKDGL